MEEQVLTKIPPQDIEAEQAVLGSMLVDKEAVVVAIEFLKVDDFYRKDHQEIFSAIMELYRQGKPIDIVTVKGVLESRKIFDTIGGMEYLANLTSTIYTTSNIEAYSKIVEEKSILRKLIKSSDEILKLGYDAKDDVEQILDQAEKKIFDILEKRNVKGYVPIRDVLVDAFTKLEELYNKKTNVTGVPTGFTDLDNKTSGFQPSNLILIAARPAMGKSAFVLNIAQNAAIKSNVGVAIFSLEMSKEELVNRMLCSEAMVDSSKIRTGKMEEEDWVKLAKALGPLSEAPIYIDDTPGLSTMELRAKCRKLKIEKDIGLIIIDYLQLMQGSSRTDNRQQEISEISRGLKILAKELNVPVIALSQLSRAPEARADHRPILSDLRESGSIEQDADIVMFLYRDDYYNEESEKKNVAEVIIAKQRSGPTGTTELLWLGQYTKFANLDKFR